MQFKDFLATFPSVEHLAGLDVLDAEGQVIHHIPAIEGKLGSLKLYNALAEQFSGQLNQKSAEQGLVWFAEHLHDAKQFPGKHPNIDLLLAVVSDQLQYRLNPIAK
ncbi:hypothetical protein F542_17310 [Bibersteinia trehalosi USDA-ARS-USMARC-188]|uniref:Uncharacterized protein n=5 Tax=Bibersteinia trehalosi TaxID=47735 RepID=W0R8N8_BIBTR|nr:DUF2322 family protein [Bibersteinia trehalosi]AGH37753.1 hypothetical protein WQG_4730 [Bibersteinia trehalosi USDA-ARS-USMARC-192]AHG82446.1 hypothetical protein F542_17310 [Bibersteinia trehalosi USDA-ARS-USMARC-188]AHG84767.1 hypothetical protein F543_19060 [Bibersteinia trehalosi USDA-ARS-USMARC-189]AHG85733.1 hypothetical protein F544_5010 [Bibersteinia trehalosi USDA-ARS-USMARC-190]OAQ15700.1 RNA polymerase subunit sigma-32 [Bibersteinia trehalosi Y31]